MASASCPKCAKTKFDMQTINISARITGLIYCTNCGCIVGVVGGPYHWRLVEEDLSKIKLDLVLIKQKVGAIMN